MSMHHLRDRKKAQKESHMYQELSKLFLLITLDDAKLQGISITRVSLSNDKSHVTAYFYVAGGLSKFEELLPTLILYKPSIRKGISQMIPGRYTPEITFAFDALFDKQQKIQNLIDTVSREEQS